MYILERYGYNQIDLLLNSFSNEASSLQKNINLGEANHSQIIFYVNNLPNESVMKSECNLDTEGRKGKYGNKI
jgi:hypothetical protein